MRFKGHIAAMGLVSSLLLLSAHAVAAPGGQGKGNGNSNGKGFNNGNGGGGGAAPLPVLGVSLLGQAACAGGAYLLWRRKRARTAGREKA